MRLLMMFVLALGGFVAVMVLAVIVPLIVVMIVGRVLGMAGAFVDMHLGIVVLGALTGGRLFGRLVFFRALFLLFFLGIGRGASAGDRRGVDGFEFVIGAAARVFFLLGKQRLPVGDGDLVVVGMDFREGQEALAVAAIFHEGRLQRRLHARHLGQIDIAFERPLGGGLEIEFLDLVTVENDDAGLFPVARVDEHAFGHSSLRAAGRAQTGALAMRLAGDGAADGGGAAAEPSPAAGPRGRSG